MFQVSKLKVGDKLVERGEVFRVYKIQTKKNNGKTQRIIHYKNYFTNSLNNSIICSVPEESLNELRIRSPLSMKEINTALKKLKNNSKNTDVFDIAETKSILNSNDIYKTFKIIKKCWKEKKKDGENFTKAKRDILSTAIDRAVEEVALVSGISLDKAKDKIVVALKN